MLTMTSFVGGATDSETLKLTEDDIAALVQDENAKILRIMGPPVASAVWKHPRALPQYNLGHAHTVEAIREAERSIPGIILACVSLVVMPLLSRAKRRVGNSLGSAAMHADAKQTEFCTYLSAILLAGLLLNAFLGWWWADPVAALIMVPIIAKEGIEGLQGKACSTH